MKKIIVIVVVIALVATTGVVAGTVLSKNSPKAVLKRFEQAYNDADVNGMVNCFEPKVQSVYNTINSLTSSLIGFSIDDMVNSVLFLAPLLEEYSDEDFGEMPQIRIKPTKVEKDGDYATVYCTVTLITDGNNIESEDGSIETVCVDGEWYISATEITGRLGG